jgi:hypothetical protein
MALLKKSFDSLPDVLPKFSPSADRVLLNFDLHPFVGSPAERNPASVYEYMCELASARR